MLSLWLFLHCNIPKSLHPAVMINSLIILPLFLVFPTLLWNSSGFFYTKIISNVNWNSYLLLLSPPSHSVSKTMIWPKKYQINTNDEAWTQLSPWPPHPPFTEMLDTPFSFSLGLFYKITIMDNPSRVPSKPVCNQKICFKDVLQLKYFSNLIYFYS